MPEAVIRCPHCKGVLSRKSWRYCPFCGARIDSTTLLPQGIVWNVIVPATKLYTNWQHHPNTTYRLLFPLGFDSFKAISAAALNGELSGNTWVIGYFEDEKDANGVMALVLFEVIDDGVLRLSSNNTGPCYIFM